MREKLIILTLAIVVGMLALLACSSAQSTSELPTETPDLPATIQVAVQTAVAEQTAPTNTMAPAPTGVPAVALPTADSRLPKCRGLQVAGEWFSHRTRQKYTDEKITHGLIGTSIIMGGPELSWAEASELLRVCPGLLGISP